MQRGAAVVVARVKIGLGGDQLVQLRQVALVGGRVLVASDAALLDTCKSGLVFD